MCQQPNCPCKDPRVLSYRTLRLWRAIAAQRGETAQRVIPAR